MRNSDKVILIQKGDENVNIDITLNLMEWKSIINLLNETDTDMIGYHRCSKQILDQIKNEK